MAVEIDGANGGELARCLPVGSAARRCRSPLSRLPPIRSAISKTSCSPQLVIRNTSIAPASGSAIAMAPINASSISIRPAAREVTGPTGSSTLRLRSQAPVPRGSIILSPTFPRAPSPCTTASPTSGRSIRVRHHRSNSPQGDRAQRLHLPRKLHELPAVASVHPSPPSQLEGGLFFTAGAQHDCATSRQDAPDVDNARVLSTDS